MGAEIAIDALDVNAHAGRAASHKQLLSSISLSIRPSSIVALMGRSGSGKTTLLKAVADILDPAQYSHNRRVRFPDRVLADGEKPSIGMVFQHSFLFPWQTALENVALHARIHGGQGPGPAAERLLAQVGLAADGHKYPHQLSGGMQQRVALAREFARPLDVLLMDEPFRLLDRVTQEQLVACLLMFWREYKPTIVIVTHDPSEAVELADEVYVLTDGKIASAVDVRAALSAEPGPQRRADARFQELVECLLNHLRGERT